MTYTAYFFFDGNGIGIEFPDVPGAYTCSDSIDEAARVAKESLNGTLRGMLVRGEKLPEPRTKAISPSMHEIEVDSDIVMRSVDG